MKRPEDLAVTPEQRAELGRLLSGGRMNSYQAAVELARASGDHALDVYVYNMALAGALLGPLHILEIATRNAMNEALATFTGRRDWWAAPNVDLDARGARKIEEAAKKVTTDRGSGGTPATADDVVAALEFGFWTALLHGRYDRTLWQPALQGAFPNSRRTRHQLKSGLDALRRLRNRVTHHEPIHAREPLADLEEIQRFIGFVSDPVAEWVRDRSRLPAIVRAQPGSACPVRHF